jgi:AAA15 family ATPase/GTPase
MIENIKLRNFTAFNKLDIPLSPKINIIIGENGTGKTHLLKIAYALAWAALTQQRFPNSNEQERIQKLTEKFIGIFKPLDDKLGKLYRDGAIREGDTEQASMAISFSFDQNLAFTLYHNSRMLQIEKWKINEPSAVNNWAESEPVFIPTKEMLSFMLGFGGLFDKFQLSFDELFRELYTLLELPTLRTDKLPAKSKWAIQEIEKICGGSFIYYGGGKVTFKTATNEFSANVMAEGFRKIGILARLLETGAIYPGSSGPLFWDEPETNFNPKLLKLLVEILLELSRNGQQIILATHDYVLLKWFDLLMDKDTDDISFHALFRDENGNIKIDTVKDYRSITPNVIADTFNDLTKEQVNKNMGGLGK